ncbi:MAG: hypothetical protein BGN97_12595 [Microbacterium sp. 69-10]|nr:MAG: hypothetical protein BGN97_12595 [Microbacterium sp. 69-10]
MILAHGRLLASDPSSIPESVAIRQSACCGATPPSAPDAAERTTCPRRQLVHSSLTGALDEFQEADAGIPGMGADLILL